MIPSSKSAPAAIRSANADLSSVIDRVASVPWLEPSQLRSSAENVSVRLLMSIRSSWSGRGRGLDAVALRGALSGRVDAAGRGGRSGRRARRGAGRGRRARRGGEQRRELRLDRVDSGDEGGFVGVGGDGDEAGEVGDVLAGGAGDHE